MKETDLTDSQREMLEAIRKFWFAHSYSPTFRDLMRELRMTSPNGVTSVLRTLRRKGLITIQPNITRSIVIVGESYSDLFRSSSLIGDQHDAPSKARHPQAKETDRTTRSPDPRRR
jgi:SOS-response transcriptional repressor LexA